MKKFRGLFVSLYLLKWFFSVFVLVPWFEVVYWNICILSLLSCSSVVGAVISSCEAVLRACQICTAFDIKPFGLIWLDFLIISKYLCFLYNYLKGSTVSKNYTSLVTFISSKQQPRTNGSSSLLTGPAGWQLNWPGYLEFHVAGH